MFPWKAFGIPRGCGVTNGFLRGLCGATPTGSYGLFMGIPMGCLWDSQLGTFGAPWGRGIAIGFPWGSLWCSEGPPMGFLRDSRGDTRGERCSPHPRIVFWIIYWILCICLKNTNCSVCVGIYTYCGCVAGWASGTYIDVLAAPHPRILYGGYSGHCVCV